MAVQVVIAGGGTGGHVYMGVAMAREFQKRDAQSSICFVGTTRHLELQILSHEGFHLESIDVAGLKGMGAKQFLSNLLLLPKSLAQSGSILRRFRPDIVVGVGGYSSGPVLLMAAFQRVPTLIVEPNVIPGITNRLLARVAGQAAVAFPETASYLGGKGVETGIPVRPEFFRATVHKPSHPFTVLAFGGSQGSRAINLALCDALPELKTYGDALSIVHQTGSADLELVRERYRLAGMLADVRAYIYNMPEEFAKADLIIARAGASTLAELTASGRASILVPLPTASDDHQRKNAEALAVRGAARMLLQADLTGARMADEIRRFVNHPHRVAEMAAASRALAKPDAVAQIVDLALKL